MKLRKYVIVLAFFVLAPDVQAARPDFSDLYCQAAVGQTAPAVVHAQTVSGNAWLFLPASSNLHALTLYFDGDTAELSAGGSIQDIQSGAAFDLPALFPDAPGDGGISAVQRRGCNFVASCA